MRTLNHGLGMLLGYSAKSTPILVIQVCICGGGDKCGDIQDNVWLSRRLRGHLPQFLSIDYLEPYNLEGKG